jgi:hypothetical protein
MYLVSLDCLRTGASSEFAVTCCKKIGTSRAEPNHVETTLLTTVILLILLMGQSDTFAAQRCLQVTAIRYSDFSIAWHGKRGGNGSLYPIHEGMSMLRPFRA